MKQAYLLIAAIISGLAAPQLYAARPATPEEAEMARAIEESLRAAEEEEKQYQQQEAEAIARSLEESKTQKPRESAAQRAKREEYEQAVRASLEEEEKRKGAAAIEEEELKRAMAESLESAKLGPKERQAEALRHKQEAEAEAGKKRSISFRDYYLAHKEHINHEVKKFSRLQLVGEGLTDLIGFDEVPGFNSLKWIIFIGNRLTAIPDSIAQLLDLELLNFTNNKLTTICDLGMLSKLQYLLLSNNQLITVPGLDALIGLQVLGLSNNQLTTLPDISNLKDLEYLSLYNNPMPGTTAEWRIKLGLNDNVTFEFKTPEQEGTENNLFNAIRNGRLDDEPTDLLPIPGVRSLYRVIMTGIIRIFNNEKIDISKIRDENSNNLLHLVVQSADAKISKIRAETKELYSNAKISKKDKDKQRKILEDQLAVVDQLYTKIFGTLIQFGGPKVEDMLLTRNQDGQDVSAAAIGALGTRNGIVQTIISLRSKAQGRFRMKPRPKKVAVSAAAQQAIDESKIEAEHEEKEAKEKEADIESKTRRHAMIKQLSALEFQLREMGESKELSQMQAVVRLFEMQPYTADVLLTAADLLNEIQDAAIFYRHGHARRLGSLTEALEPIKKNIDEEIKRLKQ